MQVKYQGMLITYNLMRKLIKAQHKYKVRIPVAAQVQSKNACCFSQQIIGSFEIPRKAKPETQKAIIGPIISRRSELWACIKKKVNFIKEPLEK